MTTSATAVVDDNEAEMAGLVDTELEDTTAFHSLREAREAIADCRRCDLFRHATQAVFGEGPSHAPIMLVGEQPGDKEDLAGRPFVGPAGRLLDEAVKEAGIERDQTYVTNAVKHFKFTERGKRRLHQRPDAGEAAACRFWLKLERQFVQPRVIVALGATAAHSILGKAVAINKLRGEPQRLDDTTWLAVTVHPSYLLRLKELQDIDNERRRFVDDLRRAKALLKAH
jgi:DNA polymerase